MLHTIGAAPLRPGFGHPHLYGRFDAIQSFESGFIYTGASSLFEHGTLATIRFLWTIWTRRYFPILCPADGIGPVGQLVLLEQTPGCSWVRFVGLSPLARSGSVARIMKVREVTVVRPTMALQRMAAGSRRSSQSLIIAF